MMNVCEPINLSIESKLTRADAASIISRNES